MILTCPACETKYVVKDDAIPPGGRQVRCASCKHSWHQDPEVLLAEEVAVEEIGLGGPPPPDPDHAEPASVDVPYRAALDEEIAGEPQPATEDDGQSPWGPVSEEHLPEADSSEDATDEGRAAIADERREPEPVNEPEVQAEEEFVGYAPISEEGEGTARRWPIILTILILIAVGAAAFWFFAPPEWKQRAGIAQTGATPLQLMITTSDRQPLQSGNELVAISGRVINPTDKEQNVPPIRAELRDKQTRKVVHSWTIAPPARVLGPRSSASFNSAEVDVPKGGDELTVTLGG